jgi:signal peptidase I
MNPTLEHEDFLIVFKNKNIKPGDIVIVGTDLEISERDLEGSNPITKLKMGKTKSLIKRVIAVEGDSIEITNGEVFLNGEKLEENYINGSDTFGDIIIEKIPEGKVFVMGDNRGNSLDSRDSQIGLVDTKDIKRKAILKIYPFSKIGKL